MRKPPTPPHDEPGTPVERLIDRGMEAIALEAERSGGKVERIAVFAWVTGMGEPDAVSAGHGFDDSLALLSFLVAQVKAMAEAHGMRMDLMAIDKPIGEG